MDEPVGVNEHAIVVKDSMQAFAVRARGARVHVVGRHFDVVRLQPGILAQLLLQKAMSLCELPLEVRGVNGCGFLEGQAPVSGLLRLLRDRSQHLGREPGRVAVLAVDLVRHALCVARSLRSCARRADQEQCEKHRVENSMTC
eukprot:3941983-Prymnesium_polylepis.1